ncbi:MAG TPA: hypothetical protein PK691_04570, partial [Thermomicrobiales bacterium]|nr:hypothetical protein [Thermomicrobiales bacterium]
MNTIITRRGLILGTAAFTTTFGLRSVVRAEDDVEIVIRGAIDTMAALDSFHFAMETIDGKATILGALELKSVEGDVLRPASFQATIKAGAAVMDLTVQVVAINS